MGNIADMAFASSRVNSPVRLFVRLGNNNNNNNNEEGRKRQCRKYRVKLLYTI